MPWIILALVLIVCQAHPAKGEGRSGKTSKKQEPSDSDVLFDTARILEVKIEINERDWSRLCKQSRNFFSFLSGMKVENPYNYFPATVWVNGTKIENVGVRKKGLFGSQDGVRPSLKIKFDEFQKQKPFSGINRITLNNNKQDPSQLSQIMTYELFRQAGIPSPRASYAKVIVNGTDLGIYTHVESVKKPFLKRAYGDDEGNLYEGTVADFYLRAIQNMEAKTNKKNKRRHISELARILADKDVDMEKLSGLVDLESYYRFWALEGLIRYWDGYSANQNNYFFYVHPANNKGYFIPWGTDASFLQNGGPFNNNQKVTAIYARSFLANRLFHQSGIPERYRKEMQTLLADYWNEEKLLSRVDELAKMIRGKLHSSQRGAKAAIDQTKEFIAKRREIVETELADWPPEIPKNPRKPNYGVEVGKASGKFSTTWRDKRSRNPTNEGDASIQLNLNGKVVLFKQVGAVVQEFKFPSFGNRDLNPNPPVDVVLAGVRQEDGKRMTLSLYVDMDEYVERKADSYEVSGIISEGRGGAFAGFGNSTARSLEGTISFTSASNKDGEPVAGSFKLKVIEMRGEIFKR